MELRKGYKVPKLKQFVKGFEYEVYSEGYFEDGIEDLCGWYKYIFEVNDWRDLDDIKQDLKLNNIQVKII